jgi:hypothetical protein
MIRREQDRRPRTMTESQSLQERIKRNEHDFDLDRIQAPRGNSG